jgi:peptidoglycan/LPS O-acetylase OafA/YrhL
MVTVDTTDRGMRAASRIQSRDTGIDLLRAGCVIGVVILHALMVGVTVTETGPQFVNAGEDALWMVPVSWLLQVMPLFFIIGGFAGATAFRRRRDAGATSGAFLAERIHRLLRPASVAIGVAGGGLALLALAGVPEDIVALAGYRYGQPLWFLGVFLLCQALLPSLLRWHERAPLRTLGALALAACVVDASRILSGVDLVGFLNLAFVWLTLQQLGFFFADGTIDRMSRRARIVIAIGCGAVLAASFLSGVHSPDLIENLNPPTTALLLVGVAHLMLVSLFRSQISEWSRRGPVRSVSDFVNRRTMTIYLWHMPVLLSMAGASALLALNGSLLLPEPGGPIWWLGRPLWLVLALLLTAVVAVALARVECAPPPHPTSSAHRAGLAAGISIGSVLVLLVAGTSPLTAAAAVVVFHLARRLARAGQLAPLAMSASPTSSAWRSVRTSSGTAQRRPRRAPRAR